MARRFALPESPQDTKWSLSVRFGDDLLTAGFTAAPNLILDHYAELGITAAEMMFCLHIWQFWWRGADPYPSLATIAERMGIKHRQAQNYTKSLRDKGFLRTETRIIDGVGKSTNEYDFEPLLNAIRDHLRRVHGMRLARDPVGKLSTV
jgi:DNA replication protein DnaD